MKAKFVLLDDIGDDVLEETVEIANKDEITEMLSTWLVDDEITLDFGEAIKIERA